MITAVWLMLPAYIPSPAASLFGGGKPLDFKVSLKDGERVFGDGKTFRGLFAGTVIGLFIGITQMILVSGGYSPFDIQLPKFGKSFMGSILVIFSLSFGSLLGDLFMSFLKRRLKLKRGAPLPVIDQLDFVLGAWLLVYLASPVWFISNFTYKIILIVLILTPLLHIVTNVIGYLIGVKKEPW
ncbi:CDP-2,3-bis-(O-geranylgeranyl)-sn-glycerol synthase [Methanohalobium sp.]|uniref:CDP-2,3-bis-(O-geranylgeranyl)-sn-glycerol synthase n=1 Tax=Methanohalobium sp. TaxID=2837493 RepID=UPI0025E88091|nr:CDP-2,3-bis-(O-geranylgeranyl)-sn-glycerol synthase [Methanohalobium sp.]